MSVDVVELGNMVAVDESYGHTTRGKRMARKGAKQLHAGFRTGGDGFGARADQGGGMSRVPGGMVRSDGAIDPARVAQLADMANTTGFLVSPLNGGQRMTGWAVAARKDRERMIGGTVRARDIRRYIRDNVDMLIQDGKPVTDVMVCAVRDHAENRTYLNMVGVFDNHKRARTMAQVHGCGWFVDVQSGRTTLVTRPAQ
jgi:hypothetical protein